MDMRGIINEFALIRTSDGCAFELNRHFYTRVDSAPAFGHVSWHSPILPLPVRTTIPSGPNGFPERTLRDMILRYPPPNSSPRLSSDSLLSATRANFFRAREAAYSGLMKLDSVSELQMVGTDWITESPISDY